MGGTWSKSVRRFVLPHRAWDGLFGCARKQQNHAQEQQGDDHLMAPKSNLPSITEAIVPWMRRSVDRLRDSFGLVPTVHLSEPNALRPHASGMA
jgi:hypothetical protein